MGRGVGVAVGVTGVGCSAAADVPGGGGEGLCALAVAELDVGEIVTVRPSRLKLAITGMVTFTVSMAEPLPSV
jgi:hypothetical protein